MVQLRPNVMAARERLAEGLGELRHRHQQGCTGLELCHATSDLRDAVIGDLFEAALVDLGRSGLDGLPAHVALVAHAGYGRRDVAPYSDVDLMILHRPARADQVAPLADRLLRDVFDAGLILGHSVRTPRQAVQLALADPEICTSLMESRLLLGQNRLFRQFTRQFQRQVQQRARPLCAAIQRARMVERLRYGETAFLLEPNVKRSSGGLRDWQWIRWIGRVRYASADPKTLQAQGVLSEEETEALDRAHEFLLRLRNEMHFHAGRAVDVLDRMEQLRIAEVFGYQAAAGLLPVELFMRDYFRHTSQVSHSVERFAAKAQSRDRLARLTTLALGHRVEGGVRVGPAGLMVGHRSLELLRGNLTEIMRLVGLANLYDKRIAPWTWDVVRHEARRLPDALPPEASHRFLSLLAHPGRLGLVLRDLHEIGVLERFIPEFAHARGLLQFNQYHKYTVDEHCLRAVECATQWATDAGVLGRVYRQIAQKHLLHLALLIHDLGKGFPEDHREVGAKIAERAARRLGLAPREGDALKFLVGKHLLMNHLAFRRDISDQQLAVRFAVQAGSPEMLRMLFVLTAADLDAVGPGVWDSWKEEILADLFHRTMQHLADDSPATVIEAQLRRRREAVCACLGAKKDQPWFARQLEALPEGYLTVTEPQQVAADLEMLDELPLGGVTTEVHYRPETQTLQVTVATREEVTPGIFHKLTGALTSRGLEIRSAVINTLADGLVLDRFWAYDPDYSGPSPPERLEEIKAALVQWLQAPAGVALAFRRTWRLGQRRPAPAPGRRTQVNTDNSTSEHFTVLDVFTHDRPGLLYAIARSLFELGLSVGRAKIGTYLDQVVDVFYVTDQQGRKVVEEPRLEEIRRRLLDVIESPESRI